MKFLPLLVCILCVPLNAADPIDVGKRRELFVDDYLIDQMSSGVSLQVQKPTAKDVVLVTGEPWEGNTCAYYSIFQDENLYRMYYRGSHAINMKSAHEEVTCYAESKDGIHWVKPKLGLYEWNGSKQNNIVLKGLGTHCFAAFRDSNPNAPADAKYKGISRGRPVGSKGLYVFKSPDGIRWTLIRDEPVITDGYFDSQNLAFWDSHTKKYVDYHRTFIDGVRSIMMCTSDDFVTWTKPVLLKYPGAPNQHLYTNTIRPCPGAPHLRIGFPTRYLPKTQQVEPVFMASRDGVTFTRYNEAVIPQSAPEDRDGNRSNYMTNGLLQLPDEPDEWSVYATEAYYTGPDSRVRRFTYRRDGFVALKGTGEVLTKPIRYDGRKLLLNYRCGEGGSVRVEMRTEDGQGVIVLARDGSDTLTGDFVNHDLSWKNPNLIKPGVGRTVRLHFTLKDAELYAFQFAE